MLCTFEIRAIWGGQCSLLLNGKAASPLQTDNSPSTRRFEHQTNGRCCVAGGGGNVHQKWKRLIKIYVYFLNVESF